MYPSGTSPANRNPHAALGEPAMSPSEEGDRVLCPQRLEHLRVGKTRVVIDHLVHKFKTGPAAARSCCATLELACPVADDAVPCAAGGDAPELLDVDMYELAW